jgi:hypothetical protein
MSPDFLGLAMSATHEVVGIVTDIGASEVLFEFADPDNGTTCVGSVSPGGVVNHGRAVKVGVRLKCVVTRAEPEIEVSLFCRGLLQKLLLLRTAPGPSTM